MRLGQRPSGIIPPLSSLPSQPDDAGKQAAYFQQRLDELTGQTIKADAIISRNTRELRQRRHALTLLSELQRSITTDLPPSEVFARTIASVQKMLKMDRTIVLEHDARTLAFRPVASLGFDEAGDAKLREVAIQFSDAMLESGGHMLATKSAATTMLMAELREKLGVPFFVCVPVVYEGRAVAQLLSGRMREAKPFYPPMDDGDVYTFQSIAGFLGSALHNASLYAHQKRMAASFGRFVPREFLQFLGRKSIVDVQLGDQTQRDMTILFSDIRSFTTMSEKMSPKENFDFVNRYMAFCAPVVQENGGFIDKYIGDAIMALFPAETDHAVRAAIGLLRGVERFNEDWTASGGPPIAIGAGLHFGTLMLGTVGFAQRMESTVISDSVNLAARMEGLTKMYGAGVIISGAVRDQMMRRDSFSMRQVDRVKVKGKRDPVDVFEVFDADLPAQIDAKRRTQGGYEDAFGAYLAGDLAAARSGFAEVLRINPGDHAAALLRERCEKMLETGKPADWNGVVALDKK